MAGKSSKKLAVRNARTLNRLHAAVWSILAGALIRGLFSGGHWIRFITFNLPMVACVYVLESSGRPKHDPTNGKLVNEGLDLQQAGGLTDYMFDYVYLSLFGDVGILAFNTYKLWFAMLLCPGFVVYKLYGLKQQFFPGSNGIREPSSDPVSQTGEKSKRQLKREKRGDKAQVKYR